MSQVYEKVTKKPIPEQMKMLQLIFMGADDDEAEVIVKLDK